MLCIVRSSATTRICALGVYLALQGVLPASAAQGIQVSSNWAGYVATLSTTAVGSRFSSVSGSWIEPQASCSAGRESYSAVWVGLGGARQGASALEQLGTDADCTHSGRISYSSWYELLPAEAIDIPLAVHPGDRIVASATVSKRHATLRLRNLTTGNRFSITRRLRHIDLSSAEWIVEAPSICDLRGRCRTGALTDFGEAAFSAGTATARGHTGSITDPLWSATALELRQSSFKPGGRSTVVAGAPAGSLILAAPSAAEASGAFSVRWQEQMVKDERTTPPTLPGAGGSRG